MVSASFNYNSPDRRSFRRRLRKSPTDKVLRLLGLRGGERRKVAGSRLEDLDVRCAERALAQRDAMRCACLQAIHDECEYMRRLRQDEQHRHLNHLGMVLGAVDTLVIRIEDGEDLDMAEAIDAVKRLIKTTADIERSLANLPHKEDSTAPVDAGAVLAPILALQEETAMGRKIAFGSPSGMMLSAKRAAVLCLCMAELVHNSIKYGSGPIEVELNIDGMHGRLIVRDHGPGLPEGYDPSQSSGTGMTLLGLFATINLRGTLSIKNAHGGGVEAIVRFPIALPE